MKKTFPKNIPQKKLDEINFIVENIKEELNEKNIEIEKIILFWSYARWTFVIEDVSYTQNYPEVFRSDFDIMVITKKDLGEEAGALEFYIVDKIKKKRNIKNPITIIIESLDHVNDMLTMWRYFYSDVKKEGIALFESSNIRLAEQKELTKQERLEMMKEDYELWFPQGITFLETFKFNFSREEFNIWAFQLHQATESFMTAYLLVKTSYKEKTHDLKHLYNDLIRNDDRFKNWFDLKDEKEFFLFELLRDAYVRARYDKNYKISKEELEFLEEKVLVLRDLVESFCREEIEELY